MKRFFAEKSGGTGGGGSRYAPVQEKPAQFEVKTRKAVGPDDEELAENPRSRSAKLRVGVRTAAPAAPVDRAVIGMPQLGRTGRKGR